jgi:hypothetical protein
MGEYELFLNFFIIKQPKSDMKNFQLIVLTILSFAGLNAQNSGFVQPFEAQEQLNSLVVKNTEYSYAMDETQPASQLLVAPVATRLRVKGLYIVPAGQVEKPRAKEAIAAILAIMQSPYLKMLGVTFEFDPEVSVLRSNYSVADAVDWNKNYDFIKANFGQEFLSNRNIVISVLEGTTGDAGGSFGVLKMTGTFWNNCYDIFINRPHMLSTELAGWSHELGHAFGLMHSLDTKNCLAKLNIDMGTLPSLLMQQTDKFRTLYEYPLAKEEKKMLLDSTYSVSCLAFRGDRPAPLRYLRLTSGQATQSANGRNVEMIEFHNGAEGRGTLARDASGKWLERDLLGNARFSFNEVGRDDWSVYLQDPGRNVALQIDLYTSKVMYSAIGASTKSSIYNILWSKKSAGSINNPTCACAAQTFRSVSDHTWVEFRLPGGSSGQTINIPAGAYNKYVFPKCNRVWWDNLSFNCNTSTCKWEKTTGRWDADALCTGSPGNSPYVFVGEK